jgi:hypothetical protein
MLFMNYNKLDIILLRRNDSRSRKLQKQDLLVIFVNPSR